MSTTSFPSFRPSFQPTSQPTSQPTGQPTTLPTSFPTNNLSTAATLTGLSAIISYIIFVLAPLLLLAFVFCLSYLRYLIFKSSITFHQDEVAIPEVPWESYPADAVVAEIEIVNPNKINQVVAVSADNTVSNSNHNDNSDSENRYQYQLTNVQIIGNN